MTKESKMKAMLEAALESEVVKENVMLNIDPLPITKPSRRELSMADEKGFFPGVYLVHHESGAISLKKFGVVYDADRNDSYVRILSTYREHLTPGLTVIELTQRWGLMSLWKLRRALKKLYEPMAGKEDREKMSCKLEEVLGSEKLSEVLDERREAIRLAYKGLFSCFTRGTPRGLYLNNSLMRVDESSNPLANITIVSPIQAAAYLHKRGKTPQSLNKRLAKFGL